MNRLAKRAITGLFDWCGYSVVAKWRLQNLPLAAHLQDLFGLLQIDCVLDVGANVGEYGEFLRKHVGYDKLIVSFEPTPRAFATLREKSDRDQQWHAFNIGLGAEDKAMTMNIAANDRFSSLLEVAAYDDPVAKDNVAVDHQTVAIRRLDTWISEQRHLFASERIYLKIDTQGYDLQVLRGCGAALSRVAAAQSEVPFQKIYQGVGEYWDALREWHDMGFDVTDMHVTNRDRFQRAIEFDCVMVNRNATSVK